MDTFTIGNTPLQQCIYLSERHQCNILIKKEYYNLNKTSKDRPAWHMIQNAIKSGRLKSGYTIVEASSGNTGIGIAQIAQQLGYPCCIFVTKDCAREKLKLLRQLDAQIFTCDNSNGIDDLLSTQYQAAEYAANTPFSFFTDQYNNPQNPIAHYRTTGPEIWEQCHGKISHFFAGIGTGGTISGVGKYLKSKSNNIQICGIEPKGSILQYYKVHGTASLKTSTMDKIDGIGRRFIPGTFTASHVDDILQVSRQETISCAHDYYEATGTLLGFSSAAVLVGLEKYLQHTDLHPPKDIVLLFADYGDRYLNSLYPNLKEKQVQYDKL
ncbi:cysteine synthase family protein [Sphingobacterium faecale]|uniref:Cysteine synthase family protein n=1 Tax=Sphingobacterium faecale TaxID=2803775 RepID=A0ABS1R2N8_9SPHI|nr:cysteine synthase family protein [Sphingobacterium faecale]MBL1408972.1 cysteine synthase family protein [Sphingobacterium faecale]